MQVHIAAVTSRPIMNPSPFDASRPTQSMCFFPLFACRRQANVRYHVRISYRAHSETIRMITADEEAFGQCLGTAAVPQDL